MDDTNELTLEATETPIISDTSDDLPDAKTSQIGAPKELPLRRGPGRPSKTPEPIREEDLIAATKLRDSRKLPEPPGLSCNFKQMDEWLRLLTDAMWSHINIYLYRRYPIIVRKQADPDLDNYIDIITKDQVDAGLENHIRATHGGGRYRFMVNDTDKRTASTIIDSKLDISIDEVMPKFDLAELDMSHKTNMGFISLLVSKGIIDRKGVPMQPQVQVNGGDPATLANALGGMFDKFMGMYSQMSRDQQATLNKMIGEGSNNKDKGINEIFIEKLKQEDPNKQFAMMTAMLEAVKGMMPKAEPHKDDSGMWQMILKMQSDSNEKQMALMGKIIEMKNTPPTPSGDSDSWIDKVIKYKELMPGLFGGFNTPEGKRSTTEVIVDAAKEFLLPTIGIVSQIIQAKTGSRPIVPVTPGQAEELILSQQQPMTGGRVRQPSPAQQAQQANQPNANAQRILQMPNTDTSSTSSTSSQPNHSIVNDPTQQAQPTQLDPNTLTVTQKIFMQFGGMLITAIKSGTSGAEIGELLQANKMFFGQDIYSILKGQGYDQIMETMRSIPEFWSQTGAVLGDAHMEQLVKEFLNYEEFLEADEIGEDEEEGEGLPSAT